jgi:hypothetical protein
MHHETYLESRLGTRRNISPTSASEQRRVREMIDRLESSSNSQITKKFSTKKSFHDDGGGGSINRITRRDDHENSLINGHNDGFIFRDKSPHEDIYIRTNPSNITRFELNRDEILNGGRRTTSGTTVD